MPRISSAVIILLISVVGVQSWLLYSPQTAINPVAHTPDSSDIASATSVLPVNASNDQLALQLARIDTRLAALETRAPGQKPEPLEKTLDLRPGSPLATAADRKLQSLLPTVAPSQQEIMQFHASLASFPEQERIALAAALSRAINEDRIKPRL